MREAVRDAGYVVLLAAIPSVARSVDDPIGTNDVNVNGLLSVLVAARDAKVRRLVFASSAAVYGRSPELPKRESLLPKPASPYGVAKLTGEHYCRVFRELFELPTVSLRYFNIFGPHQNLKSEYASAVPKFMRAAARGETPVIFGTGEQSRDFVYIENVVDANVLACGEKDPGPGPFNIGTGRSTTVNEMVALAGQTFGRQMTPEYAPARPGDVLASEADISEARQHLGYEPRISIEEGLAEMADWMRAESLV